MQFDLSRANNGILLVDKPAGWTSFDVVAKIRGQLKAEYRSHGEIPTKRQLKVGHAGTLDPFATGLLIILLGDMTKNADAFLKLDKVYEATIRLGQVSTTGDPEGDIQNYNDVSNLSNAPFEHSLRAAEGDKLYARVSQAAIDRFSQSTRIEIEQALQKFTGTIAQIPPKFSAIKINGQRAYKLAREGKDVEIPTRTVTIYSLELIDCNYPDLKIRTHVSSGTYIRTLAEDIGEALGVGAYCKELRRISIGDRQLID